MVRLTPRAELVEEYRTRFFGQSASRGVVIKEKNFRQIETGEEQTRIVEIVTKESELQRRVQEKRERLAAKVVANMMFYSRSDCVLFFLLLLSIRSHAFFAILPPVMTISDDK